MTRTSMPVGCVIPIGLITGMIGAVLLLAGKPIVEEMLKPDVHAHQVARSRRPTYEAWLVQEGIAPSGEEMIRLYDLLAQSPSDCLTRTSDNVMYQVGVVEPTRYNEVTEKVYRKAEDLIVEQRFPEGTRFTTYTGQQAMSLETRFTDSKTRSREGIVDRYEIFKYDAKGVYPLIPNPEGRGEMSVTLHEDARAVYERGGNPRKSGVYEQFELYRQQTFTEAVRRFIADSQNNKPC